MGRVTVKSKAGLRLRGWPEAWPSQGQPPDNQAVELGFGFVLDDRPVRLAYAVSTLLAAAALAAAAQAAPAPVPLTPEAALACTAARYRGQALRVEPREGGLVQELRWLTPARQVLEIRLAGPGCLFLEVRGVGQVEAQIPPRPGR
jgi:hypothetical protein